MTTSTSTPQSALDQAYEAGVQAGWFDASRTRTRSVALSEPVGWIVLAREPHRTELLAVWQKGLTEGTARFEKGLNADGTPVIDVEFDVEALRHYIGKCLNTDLTLAQEAGHGFGHKPLGWLDRQEGQPDWTLLDLTDNVRPRQDVNFVNTWNPERVINNLYTKALIVQNADVETLLTIVQDYTDAPYTRGAGWNPAWKRDRPSYLHRVIPETIRALAGESA